MGNSNFSAVFAALDAANITFTLLGASKTPVIRTLSELPESVSSAELPIRLLIGMDGISEGQQLEFIGIGAGPTNGSLHMRWRLTDLMLAVPQAQGRGVKSVAASLVEYMGKYVDMARTNRNIATGISITNIQPSAGVYTYPGEAGTPYFGVQTILDLTEIVS